MKNLNLGILVILCLTHLSSYARGDFGAANGGDKVLCRYQHYGIYYQIGGDLFLDKLVARMDGVKEKDLFSTTDEVIGHLIQKLPELAIKLKKILESYKSKKQDGEFVWKKGNPTNVSDENLFIELPNNCKGTLKQIVRRVRYNQERVYFYYAESEMKDLEDQLSWILVHEMLWDYYDDANEVRLVNNFIHQKKYANLQGWKFLNELNKVASRQSFEPSLSFLEAEVGQLGVKLDTLRSVMPIRDDSDLLKEDCRIMRQKIKMFDLLIKLLLNIDFDVTEIHLRDELNNILVQVKTESKRILKNCK